uniref:Ring finger protein 223 n=2 Tax=Latimeria chalumnae TaxID=7897 RepID=H3BGJ6_LATCH
ADSTVEDIEKSSSQAECSICFSTYDNLFKTPKTLDCQHTFCLECLARLVAAVPSDQPTDNILCPLCRQPSAIPRKGAPGFKTNQEILSKLPPHLQQEEPVWIEGSKLCYKRTPESVADKSDFCICIDIGLTKSEENTGTSLHSNRIQGCCGLMNDWKRILLFFVLLVILVSIVLWPLQCVFTTGNIRCFTSSPVPSPT